MEMMFPCILFIDESERVKQGESSVVCVSAMGAGVTHWTGGPAQLVLARHPATGKAPQMATGHWHQHNQSGRPLLLYCCLTFYVVLRLTAAIGSNASLSVELVRSTGALLFCVTGPATVY